MRLNRLLFALLILVGCTEPGGALDAGTPGDSGRDVFDGGTPDTGVSPPDAGSTVCVENPDCVSCVADGECCEFTINCQPGSICNLPSEELFDSNKPTATCIQVVCQDDRDCEPGEICSPSKICVPRGCQNDDECLGSEQCLNGVCSERPATPVASCTLIDVGEYLITGGERTVHVVAFDSAGAVVVGANATLTTSDGSIVSFRGNVAIGGDPGEATATATVDNVACGGTLSITVLGALPPSSLRVVVYDQRLGVPIGALVDATTAGVHTSIRTTNGVAVFQRTANVDSITVTADGYASVTIMAPPGNDLLVPLPRIGFTQTAGYRGVVDVSTSRRSDFKIAIVGSNQPEDILVLGRTPITGPDRVLTEIDAPQLGLQETIEMPSTFVMGLGNQVFTADANRCQGTALAEGEVGCFLARGRAGYGAGWTLGGQLKLSTVTSVANDLSEALNGNGGSPALVSEFSRLAHRLRHGTAPFMRFAPSPNINRQAQTGSCIDPTLENYNERCGPNFARFEERSLNARQAQTIQSIVEVPALPSAPGQTCATTVTVMAAVRLGGRGVVPIGLTAGTDILDEMETPDCVVNGIEEPFGEQSLPLSDGQVPLYAAPRHSGLEDGSLVLTTLARGFGDDELARSGIVQRVDRIGTTVEVTKAMLPLPNATIDASAATISFPPQRQSFIRSELYNRGAVWIVYSPGTTQQVVLPVSPQTAPVLTGLTRALVVEVDTDETYGAIFDPASSFRANETVRYVNRFASGSCRVAPTQGCTIR